jgi:hypothetical protein
MKYIILLTFFFISFTAPYREKVPFDYGIYKGEYSEVYEQPIWIQYSLYKPVSLVSRGHLNFYKPYLRLYIYYETRNMNLSL